MIGKPSLMAKRSCAPNSARVPVPVRSGRSTPRSITSRRTSRYCLIASAYGARPRLVAFPFRTEHFADPHVVPTAVGPLLLTKHAHGATAAFPSARRLVTLYAET